MCIKMINSYFKTATRADVNNLRKKVILSERQTARDELSELKHQSHQA